MNQDGWNPRAILNGLGLLAAPEEGTRATAEARAPVWIDDVCPSCPTDGMATAPAKVKAVVDKE